MDCLSWENRRYLSISSSWNFSPLSQFLGSEHMTNIPVYPDMTTWLVVDLPLWKMMEFVSWDDDIPNIWKNMFQTTNQQHTLSDNNNYNIHNVLMQNVPFHFRPPHAIISAGQPASPPFNWLQPMDLLLLSYLVRGIKILMISLYIYILY